MRTDVIRAETPAQVRKAAAAGAKAIRAGKLVGFATETVYGIAAAATHTAAMERLRDLKDRPSRPFSVHLGRPEDARRYVADPPPAARRLIEKAWPGPVTLLLPVGGALADRKLQAAGLYDTLCRNDVVGLRCPDEPVALAMLAAVRSPVVAPSANLTGHRSPRTAEDVRKDLDGRIDLLIDSGPTRWGTDSTIVRFRSDGSWRVVRRGVYDTADIRRLLRRVYLFVCTGNTCRSPMAAGLARNLLAERLGVSPGRLLEEGVEVLSAGAFAADGARVSPEALDAAAQRGADIADHRAQKLTAGLIAAADLVFCMTDSHVQAARRLLPSAAGKVRRLDETADIADPIGGGNEVYDRTARHIAKALAAALRKLKL